VAALLYFPCSAVKYHTAENAIADPGAEVSLREVRVSSFHSSPHSRSSRPGGGFAETVRHCTTDSSFFAARRRRRRCPPLFTRSSASWRRARLAFIQQEYRVVWEREKEAPLLPKLNSMGN
jgi:hypothetical protein